MIALSVSEISALDSFCDKEDEEELGILVVGYKSSFVSTQIKDDWFSKKKTWREEKKDKLKR